MNREEKQAIKILKSFEPIDLFEGAIYLQALEKLTNLIEKLQKENEKYKRLAEMNLKNAEEFKDNMCEHRCLLKSENEELKADNYELNNRITDLLENIPIQKVKDKIEELNQYYKKEIYPSLYQWGDITITEHYDEMIALLQELIKESEE